MTRIPAISVVIPVHNAVRYLDACLTSVVAQDFADIEIVLYDDGSTDGSSELLAGWAARDPRIRLERGLKRLGAAASSNRVTRLSRAPLVARMDADDVMLPGRLSAQAACLAAHPAAVAVGGLAWTIDAAVRRVRPPDLARLLRASPFAPFAHSAILFRRSAWECAGGYRAEAEKWEDIDLFLRLADLGEIWVLSRPVIEYRQHDMTSRVIDGLDRLERALDAMNRTVSTRAGPPGARIAPAAYRHIGASWLWSGGRPRLLGRILRRARLRADRETLALLAWAAMAQVAPRTLRVVLRADLTMRNRAARRRLAGIDALQWRPNREPQTL